MAFLWRLLWVGREKPIDGRPMEGMLRGGCPILGSDMLRLGEGIVRDGMLNKGMLKDGMLKDGMLMDGMLSEGALNEGMLKAGLPTVGSGIPKLGVGNESRGPAVVLLVVGFSILFVGTSKTKGVVAVGVAG